MGLVIGFWVFVLGIGYMIYSAVSNNVTAFSDKKKSNYRRERLNEIKARYYDGYAEHEVENMVYLNSRKENQEKVAAELKKCFDEIPQLRGTEKTWCCGLPENYEFVMRILLAQRGSVYRRDMDLGSFRMNAYLQYDGKDHYGFEYHPRTPVPFTEKTKDELAAYIQRELRKKHGGDVEVGYVYGHDNFKECYYY